MAGIAGMIGIVTSVVTIFDKITNLKNGSNDSNKYAEGLKALKIDDATIQLAKAGGNMVNFMSKHIVEPVIVVSKNSYNRKDIDNMLEFSTDAYLSFYVTSFKILINIHGLQANQALSVMASKGFEVEEFVDSHKGLIDLESMDSLPLDLENVTITKKRHVKVSESEFNNIKTIVRTVDININAGVTSVTDTNGSKSKNEQNVEINIPIIVKASVIVVDANVIAESVEHRNSNVSFFKRMTQYRVGLLTTRDLLLCGDLIAKYKEGALKKENFSSTVNSASRNHLSLDMLLDKHVGLNKMIFTYILTDSELDLMAKKIGYDINKPREKTKFMNTLLAFNVTSINEDRNMANIYINGINGFTPSAISRMSKGGGKDTSGIEALATALMASKPF